MTTCFLSRATIRRDVPAAALWHDLVPKDGERRLQASHRLVWTLFADTPERTRDFLWRESEPGTFYLLSSRRPTDRHSLFHVDEPKEFTPRLRAGDALRFALRANATVSRKSSDDGGARTRGKPSDVVMDTLHHLEKGVARAAARQQAIQSAGIAWLSERAVKCGFRLGAGHGDGETSGVCVTGYQVVRLDESSAKRRIGVLDYEGVLIVEDPNRVVESIVHGFGRAKAFGCGLMLIRRA